MFLDFLLLKINFGWLPYLKMGQILQISDLQSTSIFRKIERIAKRSLRKFKNTFENPIDVESDEMDTRS
ncbi:hypothetical protein L1987_59350 [Smallanthus sonchifolius]|uniref:Uncharacterized protein n=1 Tax=Smallanthus sonchifolius TaxID=185202 RepID=A0ACB9D591_9ASTR|nr:hypothetical protein L1987_59350 [Smallanthus sonchifolius]